MRREEAITLGAHHPVHDPSGDQYHATLEVMQAVRRFLSCCLVAGPILAASTAESQTLRGSRASVDRIHRQALNHSLHFYESPAAVRKGVSDGRLVRLRGNADYHLASVSYPYVLPATELFVARLARQYRAACGEKLVVTSAMRPRSFRLVNSVDKSVHPTGMAIDLRRPANARCLAWLRRTLLALDGNGVIEAVEERNPPHFHVAVFPNPYERYVRAQGGRTNVAGTVSPAGSSVAVSSFRASNTYRVRRGDSLWAIARKHGRSVDEIKQANSLNSSRIVAGQVLVIPEAR
jgi:nucleoid-associated protein YgaU